jgi:type III pantothenate kinase
MNLVIDNGNSSAKVGIFDDRLLADKYSFNSRQDLQNFLKNFSGESLIISSVNEDAQVISDWASGVRRKFVLLPTLPLPITVEYSSKETLGVDRIAAVCGAYAEHKGSDCLVIDAGTCITYEFLTKKGVYKGGAISPGLRMRFKAMNAFTARLPLVEPDEAAELTGDSTIRCMQSGVFFGIVDEMNGMIRRYSEKYPEIKIILCGGDTPFFENKLKASIFASPELVLGGLNSILLHNANL